MNTTGHAVKRWNVGVFAVISAVNIGQRLDTNGWEEA